MQAIKANLSWRPAAGRGVRGDRWNRNGPRARLEREALGELAGRSEGVSGRPPAYGGRRWLRRLPFSQDLDQRCLPSTLDRRSRILCGMRCLLPRATCSARNDG